MVVESLLDTRVVKDSTIVCRTRPPINDVEYLVVRAAYDLNIQRKYSLTIPYQVQNRKIWAILHDKNPIRYFLILSNPFRNVILEAT